MRGFDRLGGEVEVVHARGQPVGIGRAPRLGAQPGEQLRGLRAQCGEVLDAAEGEGIGHGLELLHQLLDLLGGERLELLGVEVLLQPGAPLVEELVDEGGGGGGRGGRDRGFGSGVLGFGFCGGDRCPVTGVR